MTEFCLYSAKLYLTNKFLNLIIWITFRKKTRYFYNSLKYSAVINIINKTGWWLKYLSHIT